MRTGSEFPSEDRTQVTRVSTHAQVIVHNSFNGKPKAQANHRKTDALGLPSNEETYARVLYIGVARFL